LTKEKERRKKERERERGKDSWVRHYNWTSIYIFYMYYQKLYKISILIN
jgi:hypothetical protein